MENEGLEFHRLVRQGYLDQASAEPERIKVVDAGRAQRRGGRGQVWALVEPLLKQWKRGQCLSGVLGQGRAVAQLEAELKPPAAWPMPIMFVPGRPGWGGATTALALFAAANCPKPPGPNGACGTCGSCHRLAAGQPRGFDHPGAAQRGPPPAR